MERLRSGDLPAADDLTLMLHGLAGSGGSYGLDVVTERAREAERAVKELIARKSPPGEQDIAIVRGLIERIAEAFARAR